MARIILIGNRVQITKPADDYNKDEYGRVEKISNTFVATIWVRLEKNDLLLPYDATELALVEEITV